MTHIKRTCKRCGLDKFWRKTHKKISSVSSVNFLYVDENNKRWNSRVCPECFRYECKMNHRKAGRSKPVDEVTAETTKKGRWAERVAGEHFRKMGFTVELTSGVGPDLTLFGKTRPLFVEVKSVIKGPSNRWYVAQVCKKRTKDDYIAMVFREDHIVVQPMNYHLKQCNKTGRRYIISLDPTYIHSKARKCSWLNY